jgi:hypothetical protein
VGPKAVLDAVVKRKIPSPRWESNPRTPLFSTKHNAVKAYWVSGGIALLIL